MMDLDYTIIFFYLLRDYMIHSAMMIIIVNEIFHILKLNLMKQFFMENLEKIFFLIKSNSSLILLKKRVFIQYSVKGKWVLNK